MSPIITSFILFFILCAPTQSFAEKEEETGRDTIIAASDIMEYIEKERPILSGKHLVDLVERFKPTDSILNKRFDNAVNVLNLQGISLKGENLEGVSFRLANMVEADLRDANATNTSFVGVDFRGADLRNADFSNANLSRANFTNADITGAKFHGANLFKANFLKAKGASREEIENLQTIAQKYRSLKRQPLVGQYDQGH